MTIDSWERTRGDIRQGDLQIRHGAPTIAGTYSLEAVTSSLPYPVGMLWYRWTYDSNIEILNSWVKAETRRSGIRTKMHKFLSGYYKTAKGIVTAHGTEEGTEWMESAGYKQTKDGWWRYTIRRKPARKKK